MGTSIKRNPATIRREREEFFACFGFGMWPRKYDDGIVVAVFAEADGGKLIFPCRESATQDVGGMIDQALEVLRKAKSG